MEDLERQKTRLHEWCQAQGMDAELISDLGSGLNYQKKSFREQLRMIALGQASTLVILHKDRLLRFGANIAFDLCRLNGTQVVILDDQAVPSLETRLVADMIELMTVFSARVYGARSHKNRSKAA